ncbi:reprolysin-like metallopeptidase [Sinomicrobium weinanense]|uniref:Proprotein convertase P-domain-containing protein n=1 Tax=Sinomicrobium weinanense TaxID=2842200 RepID=A0A926JSM6_9FLAO|nr:zinc-dependent metalloprotease family protein [Sinomicrobium weinanense]MBC9796753.1 proprotein convertase P-domain-containing protein [Sinomicrobium weinanense]MBU3124024.1 proprotein convertase P-domain-containing protein [Sinomicrobium weinanense]
MEKPLLSFILLFFLTVSAYAQKTPWEKATLTHKPASYLRAGTRAEGFRLDLQSLKQELGSTSSARTAMRSSARKVISFPARDGRMEDFEVREVSTLSNGLARKYPGIRSYSGASVKDPGTRIRFSVDKLGFHAAIYGKTDTYYINPGEQDKDIYFMASRKSFSPYDRAFECLVRESAEANAMGRKLSSSKKGPDDGKIRTFRLALACTGEFAQYHINAAEANDSTEAVKKAVVLSAMNTIMTRVNGIYERDMSLTMQLIDNNDELIFLDPDTDRMTNDDGNTLIDEIQAIIDSITGSSNYDIGHVFSTGGGGIASLNSPCTPSKARGVTGKPTPVGDPFAIDFVAHEMGHQFGATHTFNNYCNNNRTNATAVEPGSGSTIMAYAGICPPNIQNNSDAYFHAVSIAQMWENITAGNSTCATLENTGNNAPSADAGANYTIPAGTPFVLTGTATDPDGDMLTYTWEQIDNQIHGDYPTPGLEGGPVFRSYAPKSEPKRYFPRLSDILAGHLFTTWEVLPEVNRELNFSFLARDNHPNGGQTARDDMRIAVSSDAGPFVVTSQNTEDTLTAGDTETVTWDVAGTNTGSIAAETVDILLFTDENFSGSTILASAVPNNGSARVIIPGGIATDKARIMVKPVNGIFFAINTADLTIVESDFVLDFQTLSQKACTTDEAGYSFVYQTFSGFGEETGFSVTDAPAGLDITFSPASATVDGTEVNVSITNISDIPSGEYDFTVTGTAGNQTREVPLHLQVYETNTNPVILTSPADGAEELRPALGIVLNWEETPNADSYEIQLSTESDFTSILETASVAFPTYQPENLENDQIYYWRVKPENPCGDGTYSDPFSFSTLTTGCSTYTSNETVVIPKAGASTVTSSITITDDDIITGGISLSLNISHTYVSDLTINLTSPEGTTVLILSEICGEAQNISAVFSDTGVPIDCNNNPAIGGTVRPMEALTGFRGESLKGTWTLSVTDKHDQDGGSINSFSISRCPTPANDNFRIKVTDESCKGTNDGKIELQAETAMHYQIAFNGNGTNISEGFTDTWQAGNLQPGTYSMCITIADNTTYKQCFDVTVAESGDLSVYSLVNNRTNTVELQLNGSSLYTIALNGTTTQTTDNTVSLDLASGKNTLMVKTDKPCQGIYKEDIYIAPDDVVIYPNPFTDSARVYIGSNITGDLHISVYTLSGRLICAKKHWDVSEDIDLRLSFLSPGIYLVKVQGKDIRKVHKIIKQ